MKIGNNEEDEIIDSNKNSIILEGKIINSYMKQFHKNEYSEMKFMCKIKTSQKVGNGFFVKLLNKNKLKKSYYMISSNHVIKNEMIINKEIIEIYYDIEINGEMKILSIKLDKEKRIIKQFSPQEIDAVAIEIIKKDNINKAYFQQVENIKTDELKKYENSNIYIPQFTEENHLSYSKGQILHVNSVDNDFFHTATTEYGSSGSPIILVKTFFIIGIHVGNNKSNRKKENYGQFINTVISSLNEIDNENDDKDYIYENGDFYKGEMVNGLPNGKGQKTYLNGKIYVGTFLNGEPYGIGTKYYTNGDYYIGQWKNSLKNGKGILYDKYGNIKLKGYFENDIFIGKNKCILKNDIYYNYKFDKGFLNYNKKYKNVNDIIEKLNNLNDKKKKMRLHDKNRKKSSENIFSGFRNEEIGAEEKINEINNDKGFYDPKDGEKKLYENEGLESYDTYDFENEKKNKIEIQGERNDLIKLEEHKMEDKNNSYNLDNINYIPDIEKSEYNNYNNNNNKFIFNLKNDYIDYSDPKDNNYQNISYEDNKFIKDNYFVGNVIDDSTKMNEMTTFKNDNLNMGLDINNFEGNEILNNDKSNKNLKESISGILTYANGQIFFEKENNGILENGFLKNNEINNDSLM